MRICLLSQGNCETTMKEHAGLFSTFFFCFWVCVSSTTHSSGHPATVSRKRVSGSDPAKLRVRYSRMQVHRVPTQGSPVLQRRKRFQNQNQVEIVPVFRLHNAPWQPERISSNSSVVSSQ